MSLTLNYIIQNVGYVILWINYFWDWQNQTFYGSLNIELSTKIYIICFICYIIIKV